MTICVTPLGTRAHSVPSSSRRNTAWRVAGQYAVGAKLRRLPGQGQHDRLLGVHFQAQADALAVGAKVQARDGGTGGHAVGRGGQLVAQLVENGAAGRQWRRLRRVGRPARALRPSACGGGSATMKNISMTAARGTATRRGRPAATHSTAATRKSATKVSAAVAHGGSQPQAQLLRAFHRSLPD